MTRLDRLFAAITLAVTILIPGSLMALSPFNVPQETFGMIAGWTIALAIMVPSYVVLTRAARHRSHLMFVASFVGGSLGRFMATLAAILTFHFAVPNAPMKPFLLTFFLGYFSLGTLKVFFTVGLLPGYGKHG